LTTISKASLGWRGWFVFYNLIVVPALFVVFHVAAWFSPKIRAGIRGRALLLEDIAAQIRNRPSHASGPRIWIHAASMGEYEQARPLIREIRQRFPECLLVLSFFSPSAFNHVHKSASLADVVCYLPFDSRSRARRFLRLIQPDAGIFIRHDLWPNHLRAAKQAGAWLLLACASVHEKSLRHKPLLRSFNRAIFECFDVVAAISQPAAAGLEKFIPRRERVIVAGDTRYDQVLFRSVEKKLDGVLPATWMKGGKKFIVGSAWPEDAAVVAPAFSGARQHIRGAQMIIVPHEPTPAHVQQIMVLCASAGLTATILSQYQEDEAAEVLIVDRIGILANVYGAGQVAFVGGSFGPGVHNVLEAAAHGAPVLFGPQMRNSAEAIEMAEAGIGNVIADSAACERLLIRLFQDAEHRRALAEQSRAFVLNRCGASTRLANLLQEALRGKFV
jgi:3-deoxy-D-manno-octulosonic-acid transferase